MPRWNRVRNRVIVTLAIMSAWLAMPMRCTAEEPRVWLEVPDEAISHTSPAQQLHRDIHGIDCTDETHVRLLQRIIGGALPVESTDSVDLIVARGD